MWAAAALGFLLLLGLVERWHRDLDLAAVPLRIHVNGTRGKSTVTRLIRAALAEAGIPALAKTTGTVARLILPDGTERPVRRWGRTNIREQLWALRQARRTGAWAAVLECMAVRPDLQWVAEHDMVRASIGVITNVRSDHAEAMGRTPAEVAASLANTIPRRGLLVTGDPRFLDLFRQRAAELGTEVRLAGAGAAGGAGPAGRTGRVEPPAGGGGEVPPWWAEDAACALEVTRALGVADEVALAGMRRAVPDPGALREVTLGGVPGLDASAANDPESLDLLLAPYRTAERRFLFVYNHREDRPERLRTFLAAGLPGETVLTGDSPGAVLRRIDPSARPRRLNARRLAGWLAERAREPDPPLIVLCGNTKGLLTGWPRGDGHD